MQEVPLEHDAQLAYNLFWLLILLSCNPRINLRRSFS